VITHAQLLRLGFSRKAIKHRIATGRLRPLYRGVYSTGRAEPSQRGRWMAAVLACGEGAMLGRRSAGAMWGILPVHAGAIEVAAPRRTRAQAGIALHRARRPGSRKDGIPLTTPAATLVDLATQLGRNALEAAIGEADKQDLVDPEALRAEIEPISGRPGVARLRTTLDRRTFRLTDSQLERLFLPLARRAGLPAPDEERRINGHRVDFVWRQLGLVVETDGLRYHRTPVQQSTDLYRDHAHAAEGLQRLRFSHDQIRHDPGHVERTLRAVT